jgi:hypothetical protein
MLTKLEAKDCLGLVLSKFENRLAKTVDPSRRAVLEPHTFSGKRIIHGWFPSLPDARQFALTLADSMGGMDLEYTEPPSLYSSNPKTETLPTAPLRAKPVLPDISVNKFTAVPSSPLSKKDARSANKTSQVSEGFTVTKRKSDCLAEPAGTKTILNKCVSLKLPGSKNTKGICLSCIAKGEHVGATLKMWSRGGNGANKNKMPGYESLTQQQQNDVDEAMSKAMEFSNNRGV